MRRIYQYYLFMLLIHLIVKESNPVVTGRSTLVLNILESDEHKTSKYGTDLSTTPVGGGSFTLDTPHSTRSRRKLVDTFQPSENATYPPSQSPTILPPASPSPTITVIEKWYIHKTGPTIEEPISSDIILISLPFKSSNKHRGAQVFSQDCMTPFNDDAYFDVDTTTPISNQQDDLIEFNTTLRMNVAQLSATGYWKPFTDGGKGGSVEICVETYLSFPDMLDIGIERKVAYVQHKLNIFVLFSSKFDVKRTKINKEEVTHEVTRIDYTDLITAYECHENDLYQPAMGIIYNPGDEIMVCVTTVNESSDIIKVEEYVNIKASQAGVSDYNFMRNSVSNPDITSFECCDGPTAAARRVCFAKIRALARFFSGKDPPDLTITGSVFVTREERRLRNRNLRAGISAPKKTNEEDPLAPSDLHVEEHVDGEFQVKISLRPHITSPSHVADTPERVLEGSEIILVLMIVFIFVYYVLRLEK